MRKDNTLTKKCMAISYFIRLRKLGFGNMYKL